MIANIVVDWVYALEMVFIATYYWLCFKADRFIEGLYYDR
jgi:hypothetical protein